MKRTIKSILVVIVAYLWLNPVNAQTDSITISKEKPDSVDVKYDRIYKLFIEENNREIKHLWKIDLVNFKVNRLNISFEQKFGKCFSSETELMFAYTLQNTFLIKNLVNAYTMVLPNSINKYAPINYLYSGNRLAGIEKVKYFYNQKRRVSEGKNINGFAGNYIMFHLAFQYATGKKYALRNPVFDLNYRWESIFAYGIGIGYGLQRRIGNIGFFDPSLSVFAYRRSDNHVYKLEYFSNMGDLGIALNLNVGFAVDSFSNLKRMLKK